MHRIVFVAAVMLHGCDRGETAAPAEGEAEQEGIGTAEFCKLVMGAAQKSLQARCSDAEQKEDAYRYLTELVEERVRSCTSWLEADVNAGRVRLHAKAARACAAALDKQSWKELLQARSPAVVAECRALIVGKQEQGEKCRTDATCAAGLYCQGARRGEEGTCKPLGASGAACDERSGIALGWVARPPCAAGLHCAAAPPSGSFPLGFESAEAPADGSLPQEFGIIGLLKAAAGEASFHGLDRVLRGLKGADPLGVGGKRGPAPKVRMGAVSVSGRLPPEVIQRIVRMAFGRFRLCYENGLRTNAGLEGRVSIAFVINRDGKVSDVKVASSDLPDNEVANCIAGSFHVLTFPQPEGGVVNVTFPIVLHPPEAAAPGASASSPPAPSAPTEIPTDGTCRAAPKVCTHDGQCADGLRCHRGVCAAELSASAGRCDDSTDCQSDLFCKLGVCAPRKKDGESCNSSLQCRGVCMKDDRCASFCDD